MGWPPTVATAVGLPVKVKTLETPQKMKITMSSAKKPRATQLPIKFRTQTSIVSLYPKPPPL